MPYKASGRFVMVRRSGRWVVLKKHPNEQAANAHAAALNANVGHNKEK